MTHNNHQGDGHDIPLRRSLAIAIVKKRKEQHTEVQKWKSLAASLEGEIRQVKQQRDHLQLQIEKRQTESKSGSQPNVEHQSGTKLAEASHNIKHQETAGASAELCEQQATDLASSRPSTTDPCADALKPDLSTAYAAQLGPLAAETDRMLSTGMTQEACRFLMEVRSMQLASQAGGQVALLAADPDAQDHATQQRADDDDGASVRWAQNLVKETSPLQAVVWFILGPIFAIPPGALQSAYATDALDFIQQHLEGAGPKDRDSLRTLSAGILRTAMAAQSEQEGIASGTAAVAFDLLAALLQQPIAGVTVLRAAAAELESIVRQHVQMCSNPDGGGTDKGSADGESKGQASLLILLLEDCFGLLPGWLHELHDDASSSADLAKATQDVLAAHKACTAETAKSSPELVSQTRSMAAALITSLELARDSTCGGLA